MDTTEIERAFATFRAVRDAYHRRGALFATVRKALRDLGRPYTEADLPDASVPQALADAWNQTYRERDEARDAAELADGKVAALRDRLGELEARRDAEVERCRATIAELGRSQVAHIAEVERQLDEARVEAERLRAMPRPGQALFNALAVIAPGFAEEVRGTDLDPFHDDTRIAACLAAWRGDLLEDAAIGAAIGPRVEEMQRVLATTKGGS